MVSTVNNALLEVAQGRLETALQNPKGVPSSEAGQFHLPCGVAANASHVLVADTFNHRIQVFDRKLRYVGAFGGSSQLRV